MQMQTASVFISVALNEGITMREMQVRTGLTQASCSRNVSLLSDKGKSNRNNQAGFGLLVAKEDPEERRRKIVILTPKGKRIATSLASIVKGGEQHYE